MPRKLLLVGEPYVLQKSIADIFCNEYTVLQAGGYTDAVDILADLDSSLPSALVLNLSLPLEEGFHILKQLRRIPFLGQTPILVTAAEMNADIGLKALAFGANDFFTISRDPSIILYRLRNVIRLLDEQSAQGQRRPIPVTSYDLAKQKQAGQQALESTRQLHFLNEMAQTLLSHKDTDSGINMVLRETLAYFGGKRAFVVELDEPRKEVNTTYEVCANDADTLLKSRQGMPLRQFAVWYNALEFEGCLAFEDANLLDERHAVEKQRIKARGVRSLLLVALRRDVRLIGALGIDGPTRHSMDTNHLKAIADSIALTLARRDAERENLEQQYQKGLLQQEANAARASNLAKSEFLSRISHDMRTPLTSIIALSAPEMTDSATSAQKTDYLRKINASGDYLLGIINDVLDMSKIESKKLMLNLVPYSMAEFRESITTIIGGQCASKHIRFDFPVPASTPAWSRVDKVRFNQLFINLLSNAVKFTPEGGTVSFIIEALTRHGNRVLQRFTVRDTGIGMSPEFLPHVFEAFAQENRTGSLITTQGTGLGMTIVKQLVDMMNGSISIESEEDKGTAITVELPLETVPIPTHAPSIVLTEHADGHVLLCEDHPLNAQIIATLLKKRGYVVDVAENGKIGLDMFQTSPAWHYAIILMDIRMPVMNGLEAAQAIRALPRADAAMLPIVALTADAFDDTAQAAKEAGIDEHLSKPIQPAQFFETISRLIHTHTHTHTHKKITDSRTPRSERTRASSAKQATD